MHALRSMLLLAAGAGILVAVAMTLLQFFSTVPLIHQAETYEAAAAVAGHDHGTAATPHDDTAAGDHGAAMIAHDHGESWEPADGFQRMGLTAIANGVTAVGFALLLVAVSEFAGGICTWREGFLWGLAGFAVFTLAPGLGLPPELPAMPAADLDLRQLWWTVTVAATAAGLSLIVYGRGPALAIVGAALLVLPHVVGAPQPASFESPIPEDLHHRFVVAVTVTNLIFWLLLGYAVAFLRPRLAADLGVPQSRPA